MTDCHHLYKEVRVCEAILNVLFSILHLFLHYYFYSFSISFLIILVLNIIYHMSLLIGVGFNNENNSKQHYFTYLHPSFHVTPLLRNKINNKNNLGQVTTGPVPNCYSHINSSLCIPGSMVLFISFLIFFFIKMTSSYN